MCCARNTLHLHRAVYCVRNNVFRQSCVLCMETVCLHRAMYHVLCKEELKLGGGGGGGRGHRTNQGQLPVVDGCHGDRCTAD